MCENLAWCLLLASIISCVSCYLHFEPNIVEPLITECAIIKLWADPPLRNNVTINLDAEFSGVTKITPKSITVAGNSSWNLQVCAENPGLTAVLAKVDGSNSLENDGILHVLVGKIGFLKVVAIVVGWIYFCGCAFSFYPQMYENYTRQSVVGLNFDYCILNIVGFFSYLVYNIGMMYVPLIENEYFRRHPTGLNPIRINDIFFSAHGFLAAVVTMCQCYIYERSNQRITKVAKMILLLYGSVVLISGIVAYLNIIHWLDFLYNCSYIKLSVTVIKYIPQAVMNYTRKSTVGYSILNVILDFIGGLFTLVQMFVIGYNYDDWQAIWGAPTKFGLGLSTVIFDSIFIYQHYILYRIDRQIDKNKK